MKTMRKRYSAAFKAKVALEVIRGDLTLAELAAKQGVHHTMIAAWKRQAIEGMASTFSGAGDAFVGRSCTVAGTPYGGNRRVRIEVALSH
jgi:transposase